MASESSITNAPNLPQERNASLEGLHREPYACRVSVSAGPGVRPSHGGLLNTMRPPSHMLTGASSYARAWSTGGDRLDKLLHVLAGINGRREERRGCHRSGEEPGEDVLHLGVGADLLAQNGTRREATNQ